MAKNGHHKSKQIFSMKNRLISFCLFSCIGITGEIFFTSIYTNVNAVMTGEAWNWKLQGRSYIWMFFIYGFASVFFPYAMDRMKNIHIIFRLLVYTAGIYIAEFISGFLLEKFTGVCPWEYKNGLHILGYIRLDYFPAWMVFAYLLERTVIFFRQHQLLPS